MLKLKNITIVIVIGMQVLMLGSCGNDSISYDDNKDYSAQDIGDALVPTTDERVSAITDNITSYIIGDFQYPKNPAKQLRIALKNDINERGLPMVIGDIEQIVFNNREYMQIKVDFSESGNIGVILFLNRHLDFDLDVLLDERENPSFTIAIKDHNNYQDMIMILTSVIMYLSPELSLEEAQQLAILQDRTISTDGYSMPTDIGGYQIQARYTNPHLFIHTPYFDAKLGVRVRAIKQLWQGTLDTGSFHQLLGPQDYYLLNVSFWDESRHPEGVYADFIVKNTWQYQCWRHGRTFVVVDVESMSGRQFSFGLDTWIRFHDPYEFGVGQEHIEVSSMELMKGVYYLLVKILQSQQSGTTWTSNRHKTNVSDGCRYHGGYPMSKVESLQAKFRFKPVYLSTT